MSSKYLKLKVLKYVLSFVFVVLSGTTSAQSISEILKRDNKVNDSEIETIVEIKTYFESSSISKYKRTFYYNENGFLTKMVGLDSQGKLSTRMGYEYDDLDNLILMTDEKWNHSLGYRKSKLIFEYDSIDIQFIKWFDHDNKMTNTAFVKCENHFPISLHNYQSNGVLLGYEIAEYNFQKNSTRITFYNNEGVHLGRELVLELNLNGCEDFKLSNCLYNNYGDIVEETKRRCFSCDDFVIEKHEYKYDKKDNWIKKTTYQIKSNDLKKVSTIKRTIKYRKNAT